MFFCCLHAISNEVISESEILNPEFEYLMMFCLLYIQFFCYKEMQIVYNLFQNILGLFGSSYHK